MCGVGEQGPGQGAIYAFHKGLLHYKTGGNEGGDNHCDSTYQLSK